MPYARAVRAVILVWGVWGAAGCSLALELDDPSPAPDVAVAADAAPGRIDRGPGDQRPGDAAPPDARPPEDATAPPRDAAPRRDARPLADAGAPDARPRDAALPDAAPDAVAPDAAPVACPAGFVGPRCDRCADPALEGPLCDQCVDARRAPPACGGCAPGFGGPDCAPAVDTGAVRGFGDWPPSARVTWAAIPGDVAAARAAGCRTWGARGGSALASLLALTGPLADQVQPDAAGDIALILLAGFSGWPDGQTGNAASPVNLAFYVGERSPVGGFLVQRRSFQEGDPQRPPLNTFGAAEVVGGRLRAGPAVFWLTLDLQDQLLFALPIEEARVVGELAARDGPGVDVADGRIEGYLTRDGLVQTVQAIQQICARPGAPAVCDTVAPFIPLDAPPERGADLLATLVGGYEAHHDGAGAHRCLPDAAGDCNAVGVCLLFEAQGVRVVGVAP